MGFVGKVSSVVDSREGAGGCGLVRMCLGICILLRFISLSLFLPSLFGILVL